MPSSSKKQFSYDSPASVYFCPVKTGEGLQSIREKTSQLLQKAHFSSLLQNEKICAIKQHFGEKGSQSHVKPEITKVVVDYVKQAQALPLLVETNTLYTGQRSDSYHHLMLAHKHGFSIESTGAPVVIMDGINGQNQKAVPIPGKHFSSVNLVSDLPFFDSLCILSHVKGHMLSGMGGAIKNLGMGFASRAGKLAQHSDFKPRIDGALCTRCGICAEFCPVNALSLSETAMQPNHALCIGCGECYTACRYEAISFNWDEANNTFNEKMAEHAFGAIINHEKRILFLNYFIDVTRQCDCWSEPNPVIYDNVGILASTDPIAIDQASLDMGLKVFGKDIFKEMWPQLDPTMQIDHGEKIGMGTKQYNLIELN